MSDKIRDILISTWLLLSNLFIMIVGGFCCLITCSLDLYVHYCGDEHSVTVVDVETHNGRRVTYRLSFEFEGEIVKLVTSEPHKVGDVVRVLKCENLDRIRPAEVATSSIIFTFIVIPFSVYCIVGGLIPWVKFLDDKYKHGKDSQGILYYIEKYCHLIHNTTKLL